jgi:hypothetical protein
LATGEPASLTYHSNRKFDLSGSPTGWPQEGRFILAQQIQRTNPKRQENEGENTQRLGNQPLSKKTERLIRESRKTPTERQPIEPLRNYTRAEAARVVPCAEITLIRAWEGGFLNCYRVGRKILHSGQHLIDWLEAGGKTGRVGNVLSNKED